MLASSRAVRSPRWSNIGESSKEVGGSPCPGGPEARLEDLALLAGKSPEAPGGHAGSPAEGPHEVRQISEPDLEGHVGHRASGVGEQPRGMAEACREEVLVRRHSEHPGEDPQEVKRAQASPLCERGELQRL